MGYETVTYFVIAMLMASLLMNVYSLWCLRNLARKMNYWRKNAVSSNGFARKMYYEMKDGIIRKEINNAMDAPSEKS